MLRGRPILFITPMIADRIGLHSVLLPLLITMLPKGRKDSRELLRIITMYMTLYIDYHE